MPKHLRIAVLLLLSVVTSADAAPKRIPVLIVGGGIAGLSTAYRLEKAGIEFHVLELSPRLGGRARTATYPEGGTAEVGLEEFWDGNPTLDIIRELKLPLESAAESYSTFVHQGKIIPFTQDGNADFVKSFLSADEIRKLTAWDKVTAELYARIKTKGLDAELLKLKDQSFKDWAAQKKFGLSKKTLEFIRIESEPEYGTSWTKLSALDGIAEWVHVFGGAGRGSSHVIAGNQTVAQAIGEKIGSSRISLNTQVTNVAQKDGYVEVVATNTATFEQKIYQADYVVSTVPLFRLNEIHFTPELDGQRQQAIQTQSWGAYFTAHVFVNPDAANRWFIGGESILPILSDSAAGVIYDGVVPPGASYKLLNLLVTGDSAEAFNQRTISFDTVSTMLKAALDKIWPGVSKSIQRMTFYRYHPRAIAGWPVGRSRFDDLSELMRKPDGRVYFAGDFTEGTHSDDAANSAIRVAKQITERIKDPAAKR